MELIILSLTNGTVSISVISGIEESLSHEKCIQLLGLDVTSTSLLRLTINLSLSPSCLAPIFKPFIPKNKDVHFHKLKNRGL